MKNIEKLFYGLLLAFMWMGLATYNSHASVVARSPKHAYLLAYNTAISSVTPFTVLQATSTLQAQPGALYSLIMSSGATGDYLVLFDTIPFSAATLLATFGTSRLLPPISYQSSSTVMNFDPPIEFYNGLMAINSANTEAVGIVYEPGRGLSGQ